MYTIKSKANQVSVISEYPDYRKTTRTNHKFVGCLGHGNDLAYYNGFLYVAPCDSYIELVNTKNWSHSRLQCDVVLSAIAHVAGNRFVGLYLNYGNSLGFVTLDHHGVRMEITGRWTVSNPKASEGYVITQAIGFKKKNDSLFVVLTRNDYHRNVILRTKIWQTEPDYCFMSKQSSGTYEMEGISFLSSGQKIIGSNIAGGQDKTFIAS